MSKVKICGITNAQDALWAANLGADYIGLNFYALSPRKVSVKHAKELAAQIPPFVTVVGVFVDEPFESLRKIAKSVPLKMVQLHGAETPEYCRQVKDLGLTVVKTLRLQKPWEAADSASYDGSVDYFLFDTYSQDAAGGTGEAFNWEWLPAAGALSQIWFLAGGLTSANVLEAVKKIHPPIVDVCSGVERSPTRKDYEAMKTFIQAAKSIR
jgi:phosphoribosylanthranilate isomerase